MEVHPFIHEILSIKFMNERSSIKKFGFMDEYSMNLLIREIYMNFNNDKILNKLYMDEKNSKEYSMYEISFNFK
jgi:hypothetical protein